MRLMPFRHANTPTPTKKPRFNLYTFLFCFRHDFQRGRAFFDPTFILLFFHPPFSSPLPLPTVPSVFHCSPLLPIAARHSASSSFFERAAAAHRQTGEAEMVSCPVAGERDEAVSSNDDDDDDYD